MNALPSTVAESGGMDMVRKFLAYENITATPLHTAVESCDTDNVRNLLKGSITAGEISAEHRETSLLVHTKDAPLNKVRNLLRKIRSSKLLNIMYKKNFKQLYIDTEKFKNVTTTPLHKATESHDVEKVRVALGHAEYSVNATDSVGWTPLHYACAAGNLDMVKMLLSEFKADTACRGVDGDTALMLAALAGQNQVVYSLLSEYQCPVDTKDEYGWDALFHACAGGHTDLARSLILKYDADVNARSERNDTPLHIAALCGKDDEKLSTFITEFGFVTDNRGALGRTFLHYACGGGNVNLVRNLVLDHNADVNVKDDKNNTPLHMAALAGKDEVVFTLINEFGCNVKEDKGFSGRSLLHHAGSATLVRSLVLDYNADINAKDDQNNTPLHVAALGGRDEVAFTLINEFGCDITENRGYLGRSVLHHARSINLVRTLVLHHHADINAKDDENNSPLHVAALFGRDEMVFTLINEFGCDTEERDILGRSLLHHACEGGNVNLVRTLILHHNANIHARDYESNTPLHVATYCGKDEVVLTLLNEFGGIKERGALGMSLLHHACEGGNVNLVRSLILHYNVDVNARDDQNNTPLHVAAFCGKDEVVLALLSQFGCDV